MAKKLFILFLVVFLGSSLGLKQVGAQEETVKLSQVAEFEKAKLIKPGEYKGGPLKEGEAKYYKIEISPGYQIQILYLSASSKSDDASLEYTLFDENEEKLSFAQSLVAPETKMGVFNLPSTSQDFLASQVKNRFLEVKASKKDIDSYTFEFKKVDKTDVGAGTDAGDDFGIALEIEPQDYPNNFSARNKCGGKYCSTDEKDMYKVAVEKGEKLTVKITPNPYLQPKIEFYNELRQKQKGEKKATEKEEAVEAFYVSDGDQNVYFTISDVSLKDYFGSYAMNVSIKTATAEELEEAGIVVEVPEEVVPEEEIPTLPEKEVPVIAPKEEIPEAVAEVPQAETFISRIKEVPLWLLIGALAFIVIIVVIIILALRARKRPPKPPISPLKPPAPPAPLKAPPTEEAPLGPPEARPPTEVLPTEPVGPKPSEVPKPSEEGTKGMILPPKELIGK